MCARCQMTFLFSLTTKAVFNGYLTVKRPCNLRYMHLQYPQRYFFLKMNDRMGLTHDWIGLTHDRTGFKHDRK